jgi:hypothetical protein
VYNRKRVTAAHDVAITQAEHRQGIGTSSLDRMEDGSGLCHNYRKLAKNSLTDWHSHF